MSTKRTSTRKQHEKYEQTLSTRHENGDHHLRLRSANQQSIYLHTCIYIKLHNSTGQQYNSGDSE